MTVRKSKTFDAVAEARKWREELAKKLEGMSLEEQMAYLRKPLRTEEADVPHPEVKSGEAS